MRGLIEETRLDHSGAPQGDNEANSRHPHTDFLGRGKQALRGHSAMAQIHTRHLP